MSDVVNALLPGISREKEKKNLAQLSVRSSKSAQHSEWDLNADGMIAVTTSLILYTRLLSDSISDHTFRLRLLPSSFNYRITFSQQ